MAKFFARGGQFWLDDEPQLIQAGEFHYFRTPADQWPHRLGLLRGAGFNAVAAYMPWLWHQWAEGETDFDGHSHPMRNLAGFLDLAAEMGFWIIARPGPYIMAESINEGIPPWVFSRYPQIAYVSRGNEIQNLAAYLHPDFLAAAAQWYQAIFPILAPRQVTRGGKIIMLQLDNEMGMMQWVRNIVDANADTLHRFAAHLRQTYGAELSRRYPADNLPRLLRQGIVSPKGPHAGKIVEDYRRFYRDYLADYWRALWAEAQRQGLEVPPIVNIHGFANGGKTFPIGLSQLIKVIELPGVLSATDVYPDTIGEGNYHQLLLVNELTKAVQNPEQPLFSVEFQAGGCHDFSNHQSSFFDLHTRLCVSTGMRAINHYLFIDGDNDPILSPVKRHDWGHPVRKDGSLRRHYYRYPKLSRVLAAYGQALITARPVTTATIGYVLDYFLTEVNVEATQPHTDRLTHQREVVLFDFLARGLALTHRPFDAVELGRGRLDPARAPVLFAMLEQALDAATQQKLVDYLHQGGLLIVAGRLPVEDFHGQPCTLLRDALGVQRITSDPPFVPAQISAFGYQDIPVSFVETYTGDLGEVFARRGQGEVVGFIKAVGQGQALVLGAAMTTWTLDDLDVLNQMAERMGCHPAFRLSHWADVRLSRGERGSFLFVNNYADDPVETAIAFGEQDLFGGHPVCLPARQGAILPLDWQARPGVTVHYATAEITEVTEDADGITLKTAQAPFVAELTLAGYRCEGAQAGEGGRVQVQGHTGAIELRKAA